MCDPRRDALLIRRGDGGEVNNIQVELFNSGRPERDDQTLRPTARSAFGLYFSSKVVFLSVAAGVEKFMKERSDDAISVLPAALPSCITSYHRIRISEAIDV